MSSIDVALELYNERVEQVTREGYEEAHDDAHRDGAIARAAATYAYVAGLSDERRAAAVAASPRALVIDTMWPWDWAWWKPRDRRRDLVRAGALIIAEIERLDRAAAAAAAAAAGEASP